MDNVKDITEALKEKEESVQDTGNDGKSIKKAMHNLNQNMSELEQRTSISFEEFLNILIDKPYFVIRNVFQLFHDMIKAFIGEGVDEYPDDPESIHFAYYDCNKLFVEGSDHPFFADRLFANRLVNLVEALKRSAQQNKIYIFEGPPGCGKSTFLNNLLMKFEEYANTEAGLRYETVWRFDRNILSNFTDYEGHPLFEKLARLLEDTADNPTGSIDNHKVPGSAQVSRASFDDSSMPYLTEGYIEVPCPSHDNPILMIPKQYRREFFDDLFKNDEFKWKLSTEKEYEWIFKDTPCTICSSLYEALLCRLKDPQKVYEMLYARPYRFNRRLGEGISVFNPGDKPLRQNILTNAILQRRIDRLLKDSNEVKYIFSQYAKTNNGIYSLMDIKSHNTERLIELHNIISEGVHKVEDIEENVNSLLLAVMNPEDQKNIEGFQSFLDRIEYINIPYVMDLSTEVEIYRNVFGKHIEERFLPRVLHNFARVIISTRLNTKSEAMLEWIGDPEKYRLYCDEKLQLLKMEIYTGYIPAWLTEKDRKRLKAKRRRKIIAESEKEGRQGISGRDSIKIFNKFFSRYTKEDKLINMSDLCKFFTNVDKGIKDLIPQGFLDSLLRMYDYTILQEVKESLYYYNEEQISREIQNYLFAINFEIGSVETCTYTGEKLEITEEFLEGIEKRLLGTKVDRNQRLAFREETQKEYTTKTLTQEIMVDGLPITETKVFQDMHNRYVYNLKEKVLDPFLENENFRRAIKDYDGEDFKTYDKRIRDDVTYLINNLCKKYRYTELGAKEVCIYVIDNDLAKKFSKP
ncbi:MAG: serine protein kinase PrkA [Desulfobacterales bacterium]|nr:MAG: serine protein kinase PrkA [Desulfobacterales bacterium]